jgi:hypothetical protein
MFRFACTPLLLRSSFLFSVGQYKSNLLYVLVTAFFAQGGKNEDDTNLSEGAAVSKATLVARLFCCASVRVVVYVSDSNVIVVWYYLVLGNGLIRHAFVFVHVENFFYPFVFHLFFFS